MEEPQSKKIKVNEGSLSNLTSVEILPREILCIIFSYLDKKYVKSATATCKLWFELIRNDLNFSSCIRLKAFQDLEISVARWPALKTIKFCGNYPYFSVMEKLVQHTTKLAKSNDCPPLEKVVVSVLYGLGRFFPQFPGVGTIQEFTFNPKDDIKSLQVEQITKLDLKLNNGRYEEIEEIEISSSLKLIGDTACNLKDINVKAMYEERKLIDCFRDSFGQMLKQLTDSLQRVKLEVNIFGDLQRFNLTKLCEECKKLKSFHVDVNNLDKRRNNFFFSDTDKDWIENEFPEHVEKIFQDFTDVKIQFYLAKQYSGRNQLCSVTKKPYQTTRVISTWY